MTPYQIRQHDLARKAKLIVKDKDLGIKSDAFVSKKYGEPRQFVTRVRQKAGIQTYRVMASEQLLAKLLADPDLGIIPDRDMAKRHGTTKGIVNGFRIRENIEHKRGHKTGRELLRRKQRIKVIVYDWRNVLLQTWKPKNNWEKTRQWIRGRVGV